MKLSPFVDQSSRQLCSEVKGQCSELHRSVIDDSGQQFKYCNY